MNNIPHEKSVTRLLDQDRVDAYAVAARDENPIHLDYQFAKDRGLDGTIVHGMLVLALVSETMGEICGRSWASGGSLKVSWRAPALIPATVTARVELRSVEDGRADYEVLCEDDQGTVLLTGTASAPALSEQITG